MELLDGRLGLWGSQTSGAASSLARARLTVRPHAKDGMDGMEWDLHLGSWDTDGTELLRL